MILIVENDLKNQWFGHVPDTIPNVSEAARLMVSGKLDAMADFDVSLLKGGRVSAKIEGIGQRHATILGVRTAYASEDRESAITCSTFEIQLDTGETLDCGGNYFTDLVSENYPPLK